MDNKHTIRLEPLGVKLRVASGTPLKDILFQYGVEFPCGGKGICGNCRVKLLEGDIPQDEDHKKAHSNLKLADNCRLACKSTVTQDITLAIDQFEIFILANNSSFSFKPGTGFGIAIDIGTTTLVAQLLDLETGHVLDVTTGLNPQSRYGADIITRIEYAVYKKGHDKLKYLIRQEVTKMINKLIRRNSINVTKIILVGNTVMQHLFDGTDLKDLSAYPFETRNKEFSRFKPQELDMETGSQAKITFLPSIGSFVGSDILAGILASRINESDKHIVLIDLGTNGEIVVGNKDRILCASTAAGPAFEGTNISMGMRATTGAISSVSNIGKAFDYHIIGNEKPRGICGSGLIDVVAEFLKSGKIDSGGKITGNKEKFELAAPVFLTQKDVREFQLAKGAIATGIEILLNKLNLSHTDIDKVYIAGAFGSFINIKNTVSIGLIEFPEEKIKKLGNSALIGAKMCLFMDEKELEPVLNITEHISLETAINFQDMFADKMMFM